MKKRPLFRAWFYLRMGYSIYWSFAFMGINVLTVTYFLAIERAPFLKSVFPSFVEYVLFLIFVGIPLLILTGFIHYKKIPGYKSEAEVNIEANPYTYKLPPGHAKLVAFPWQLALSKMLLKISKNEKMTGEEIKEIENLQKKMKRLIDGESIGAKGRIVSLGEDKNTKNEFKKEFE